jgi:hypothetical protein
MLSVGAPDEGDYNNCTTGILKMHRPKSSGEEEENIRRCTGSQLLIGRCPTAMTPVDLAAFDDNENLLD